MTVDQEPKSEEEMDWVNRRQREEDKQLIKDAVDEWLDKKFAAFGKWSARALAALLLAAFVYFILWSQGWHKGP